MKRAAIAFCFLPVLVAPEARANAHEQDAAAFGGSVSLSRTWTDRRYAIGSKEYDAELGYRRFRLSSTRSLAALSVAFDDDFAVTVRAGLSTLAAHASEGETLEFANALSWGLGLRFPIHRWSGDLRLGLFGSVDLFSADGSDGEVTRTHRDFWLAGNPGIEWLETSASLELAADLGGDTSAAAGLRYLTMDVSEERDILGKRQTVDFDQEEDWGPYLRVRCNLSPHVALFGGVHALDETAFSAGLDVGF
jgi:hypothetical protein